MYGLFETLVSVFLGPNDDDFSDEELVILGEEVETKTDQDPEPKPGDDPGKKPEEDPEKKPEQEPEPKEGDDKDEKDPETDPEKEPEPEDGRVPIDRFNKIYGENEHNKRSQTETNKKLEFLKTVGPDEYYKKYPDEKPIDAEEPEKKPLVKSGVSDPDDILKGAGEMQISGGQYDGQTLREVADVDPLAAMTILNDHREGIKADEQAREKADNDYKLEAQQDIDTFNDTRAQESFDKKYGELSDSEKTQVDGSLSEVMDFVEDTKNKTTNLDLAFLAINKDSLLESAMKKGAEELTKKIQQPHTLSIDSNGGDGGQVTGYDAFLVMTPEQLAEKIDKMTDAQVAEFINNAPANVRERFPKADWDPI